METIMVCSWSIPASCERLHRTHFGRSAYDHGRSFKDRVDKSTDTISANCLISQKRVEVHIYMLTPHEIGSP